jgi:hypothetical protein
VKQVQLTKGHVALVDDDDYAWLKCHGWVSTTTGGGRVRAGRWVREDGRRRFVYMYRQILEMHGLLPDGHEVDHLNGNTLDNRKANLRACTRSENLRNRSGSRLSKTGAKGVSWNATNRNWNAQIGLNGRKKHLGTFSSLEDAKAAYDAAAKEHFGDFARSRDHCGDRV